MFNSKKNAVQKNSAQNKENVAQRFTIALDEFANRLLGELQKSSLNQIIADKITKNLHSKETYSDLKNDVVINVLAGTLQLIEKLIHSDNPVHNDYAVAITLHQNLQYKHNQLLILEWLKNHYASFKNDQASRESKLKLFQFVNSLFIRDNKINLSKFFEISKEDFNIASQANLSIQLYAKLLSFQVERKCMEPKDLNVPITAFFKGKLHVNGKKIAILSELIENLEIDHIGNAVSVLAVIANFVEVFPKEIESNEQFILQWLNAISNTHKKAGNYYLYMINEYSAKITSSLQNIKDRKSEVVFWKKAPNKTILETLAVLNDWNNGIEENVILSIPSLSHWQGQDSAWKALAINPTLTKEIKKFWGEKNDANDRIKAVYQIALISSQLLMASSGEEKKNLKRLRGISLQYLTIVLRAPQLLNNGINLEILEILDARRKLKHGYQPYAAAYMDRALVELYRIAIARLLRIDSNIIKFTNEKEIKTIEQALQNHEPDWQITVNAAFDALLSTNLTKQQILDIKVNIKDILSWKNISPEEYFRIVCKEMQNSIMAGELLPVEYERFLKEILYKFLIKLVNKPGQKVITDYNIGTIAQVQNLLVGKKLNDDLVGIPLCAALLRDLIEKGTVFLGNYKEYQEELENFNGLDKEASIIKRNSLSWFEPEGLDLYSRKAWDSDGNLPPMQCYSFYGKLVYLEITSAGIEIVPVNTNQFRSHKKEGWGMFTFSPEGRLFLTTHAKLDEFQPQKMNHSASASLSQGAGEICLVKPTSSAVVMGLTLYTGHFLTQLADFSRIYDLFKTEYKLGITYFDLYITREKLKNLFDKTIDEYINDDLSLQAIYREVSQASVSNDENSIIKIFIKENLSQTKRKAFDSVITDRLSVYLSSFKFLYDNFENICLQFNNLYNPSEEDRMNLDIYYEGVMTSAIENVKAANNCSHISSYSIIALFALIKTDLLLSKTNGNLKELKSSFATRYDAAIKQFESIGVLFYEECITKGRNVIDFYQTFIKSKINNFNIGVSEQQENEVLLSFFVKVMDEVTNIYNNKTKYILNHLKYKFGELLDSCQKVQLSNISDSPIKFSELAEILKREIIKLVMVLKIIYEKFYQSDYLKGIISDLSLYFKQILVNRADTGSLMLTAAYLGELTKKCRIIQDVVRENFEKDPNPFAKEVLSILTYASTHMTNFDFVVTQPYFVPPDFFVSKFKEKFDILWQSLNSYLEEFLPSFKTISSRNIWFSDELNNLINFYENQLLNVDDKEFSSYMSAQLAPMNMEAFKTRAKDTIKSYIHAVRSNPLALSPYKDFACEKMRQFIFAALYEFKEKNDKASNTQVIGDLEGLLSMRESDLLAKVKEILLVQFDQLNSKDIKHASFEIKKKSLRLKINLLTNNLLVVELFAEVLEKFFEFRHGDLYAYIGERLLGKTMFEFIELKDLKGFAEQKKTVVKVASREFSEASHPFVDIAKTTSDHSQEGFIPLADMGEDNATENGAMTGYSP